MITKKHKQKITTNKAENTSIVLRSTEALRFAQKKTPNQQSKKPDLSELSRNDDKSTQNKQNRFTSEKALTNIDPEPLDHNTNSGTTNLDIQNHLR